MTKLITICLALILSQTPVSRLERQRRIQELSAGDTLAWARHKTGVDQDDDFESIAKIPGSNGEDQVYVVVKRTINGQTKKYIEQFQPVDFGDQNDAWFVDAGLGGLSVDSGIAEVIADYPILFPTTDQADLGLTRSIPIGNVTALQNMENDLAGNYYLTGNIDASVTVGWNGGSGFDPVGTFTGTLDGLGYRVTGLFIDRPTEQYVGLFTWLAGTAKVANLTLSNCDITGKNSVGAIAGTAVGDAAGDPIIQNCHSSGAIKSGSSTGLNGFGGLIGVTAGSFLFSRTAFVYDSSSFCTVSSAGTSHRLGGLIGDIDHTTVINCFATGTVTGCATCDLIGGLAGQIGDSSSISYCYSTGNVTGNANVGGFSGRTAAQTNGTVQKCYATGNVTGVGTGAGALSGFIAEMANGPVSDCYSWGNVTSAITGSTGAGFAQTVSATAVITNGYSIGATTVESTSGGFTDNQLGDGSLVTDSYWDTDTSGTASSGSGTGRDTVSMKTKSEYASGWDFDAVWDMNVATPAVPGDANYYEGLDHLIGESVCVYADGRPIGSFTVDASGMINIGTGFTNVLAGINYYSVYESFPLSGFTDFGPLKTKKAQITNLRMDFYETLECNLGVSQVNSSDIQFSKDSFATRVDMFSGPKIVTFPRGISREPIVYLWSFLPVPTTLRGAYVTMNVTYEGQ